jgi:hypothetical protein
MDLSGHERDKLFLSRAGQGLVDASYLSGADGIEDARAFAIADLDRDGHDDLIVVNRNAPLLRVYLNRVGAAQQRHFIGVRVEGRQPVGTRVTVRACGLRQMRELAIGTGFATSNSSTWTFGLDHCDAIDELTVAFPHGEHRSWPHVAVDRFYRIVEGKGLKEVPGIYAARANAKPAPAEGAGPALLATLPTNLRSGRSLVLVDLFASWCAACSRQGPRLDAIATHAPELAIVGLSVEPADDQAVIDRLPGATQLRLPFDAARAALVSALVGETPPLPSSLLLDGATGQVLWRGAGLPSRSDLARISFEHGRK